MGTYLLTMDLRDELKKPLGLLIRGCVEEVTEVLDWAIRDAKPSKVISVGDVVSRSLIERGIRVDVYIIDNKSLRRPIEPIEHEAKRTLHLTNPAGMITEDSWRVLNEAINSVGPVKVIVDGEEDLLTIVAVLVSPNGSIVVYGQPGEGAVMIIVNEESKRRMHEILSRMEYKSDVI